MTGFKPECWPASSEYALWPCLSNPSAHDHEALSLRDNSLFRVVYDGFLIAADGLIEALRPVLLLSEGPAFKRPFQSRQGLDLAMPQDMPCASGRAPGLGAKCSDANNLM